MKFILIFAFIIFSQYTSAIEISSMFELMKQNQASFTVKNTEKNRIYLHIGMSELNIVDGEIIKIPYTRKNIDQWQITVRPAKTIIEPGFEKKIDVTYQCKTQCDDINDKMFQLAVVPTPYFPQGQPNHNAVQMAVGFAPIITVIKKDTPPNYQIKHLGKEVLFTNFGSSLFNANMKSCDVTKECTAQAKVLAGRVLAYKLPENMHNLPLTLKLSSALGKNEKTLILPVNGELKK